MKTFLRWILILPLSLVALALEEMLSIVESIGETWTKGA